MHGDRHAISITLIGAGGTGSALMQHLARINKSMIAQGNKGIILTCIVDDLPM
jgi:choline kinase